jgi:hypothetical protein
VKVGLGGLGTRRQRFWFALFGLLALALPYATAIIAAIRAEVDARAAPAVIPTLSVPLLRVPQVAVPKLVPPSAAGPSASAPSRGVAARTAAPAATHPVARQIRRAVTRTGAGTTRRVARKLPVQSESYTTTAAPQTIAAPSTYPSSGAVAGLAGAMTAAPVVIGIAPPPPPTPAPTPPPGSAC